MFFLYPPCSAVAPAVIQLHKKSAARVKSPLIRSCPASDTERRVKSGGMMSGFSASLRQSSTPSLAWVAQAVGPINLQSIAVQFIKRALLVTVAKFLSLNTVKSHFHGQIYLRQWRLCYNVLYYIFLYIIIYFWEVCALETKQFKWELKPWIQWIHARIRERYAPSIHFPSF